MKTTAKAWFYVKAQRLVTTPLCLALHNHIPRAASLDMTVWELGLGLLRKTFVQLNRLLLDTGSPDFAMMHVITTMSDVLYSERK